MNALLDSLVQGTYIDSDTGKSVSLPIRSIVIDKGITADIPGLLAPLNLGKTLAVVSDAHTYKVLGEQAEKALSSHYNVISLCLPEHPEPNDKTIEHLRQHSKNADAYIAIGSGTINDLCKYTSFLEQKPYAVFGTAPSMNGYASVSASITTKGHKKSLSAHLPQGIFLDTDILAKAPLRLIRSGFGDALCRSTAQADWLLSHLLRGTPYKSLPFTLLKGIEEGLFDRAEGLVNGDREAIHYLAKTLILSGLGMTLCGGSYPASQGEHMIAHTMEMVHGDALPTTFHGEQIGVTTLTMAKLQEQYLAQESLTLEPLPESAILQQIEGYFSKELGKECWQASRSKWLAPVTGEAPNWPLIKDKIEEISTDYSVLHKALHTIGAPTTPAQLGWEAAHYEAAVKHAPFTRDRFTFLDLPWLAPGAGFPR